MVEVEAVAAERTAGAEQLHAKSQAPHGVGRASGFSGCATDVWWRLLPKTDSCAKAVVPLSAQGVPCVGRGF